ncbi:MAG: F0F1 ATP synthase subunit A [Candidatus Dormibacteria bacterium]
MNPFLDVEVGVHDVAHISGVPSLPTPFGDIQFGVINLDTLLSTGIAAVIVLGLGFMVARSATGPVPGKLHILFESLLEAIRNLVRSTVHYEGADFVIPLAMTLGLFILVSNWLEMVPTQDVVKAPTADWNLTFAMATLVIVLVQVYSIRVQGFGGFLSRFTKPHDASMGIRIAMVPLNIIEELVKPVTLSFRLMFNILAGGVMLALIALLIGGGLSALTSSAFGPVALVFGGAFNLGWKLFDMFIGAIQAFIFALLTIIYFGMAREGMEEHH